MKTAKLVLTTLLIALGISIILMFISSCNPISFQRELQGKVVFSEGGLIIVELPEGLEQQPESFHYTNINASQPCWSPDGQKIVFADIDTKRAPSEYHFKIARSDGSKIEMLLDMGTTPSDYPSWSPDGKKIAFVAGNRIAYAGDRPHIGKLYVIDIDNPVPKKIVDISVSAGHPSWSPDSKRIIFASSDGVIMTVNLDGTDLRRITSGFAPSWSPDGEKIAFHDKGCIYIVDKNGENRKKVASNHSWYAPSRFDVGITWSPDGRFILYLSQGRIQYLISMTSTFIVRPCTDEYHGVIKLSTVTGLGRGSSWVK